MMVETMATDDRTERERASHHTWVRVELVGCGSWLADADSLGVLSESDILPAIADGDMDAQWQLTLKQLSDEEFEALPEFEGY